MTPLRALYVDDEAPARRRLARLLKAHADAVTLVGEAANAREGAAAVDALRPDVLFLDVEMPGPDGFSLLREVRHRPHVVFITAYAAYAVQAFEADALDYLLKPVEPARLAEAVARLHRRTAPPAAFSEAQLSALAARLKPAPTTLPVRLHDRYVFIALDDVTHFEARDKYVHAHTRAGKAYLLDQPLVALAAKLPADFVQVHRACIVNRRAIREVRPFLGHRYILHLGEHPAVKVTTGPSFAAAVRETLVL